MNRVSVSGWHRLWIVGSVLWLAPVTVAGQVSDVPRTANGRPDLGGVWDFRTVTPLERPTVVDGAYLRTDEEVDEFQTQRLKILNRDVRDESGRLPLASGYNNFWYDYGTALTGDKRTSLIVSPENGRVPVLTAAAEARVAETRIARGRPAHGPEDRRIATRCIIGFNTGPPMNPRAYNNNMQLFQTGDTVVVMTEMVHDARVIPLDGRSHIASNIRQWRGDSRGRWDGDTLVVDTTHFTAKTSFRGSGPNMHLVEQFTRVDAETLLYEYTITDPESFAQPWSVAVPMRKSEHPLYEFACQEGNRGLPNILRGARAEEAVLP